MIYPYNTANVASFLAMVDACITRQPQHAAYIRPMLVRQPFFGRDGVEFSEDCVLSLNDGYIGGPLIQGGLRDNEIHFAALEAAQAVKIALPHRDIQVTNDVDSNTGVSGGYWDRLYHNGNVPLWVPKVRSEDILNNLLFGAAIPDWNVAVAGPLYPGDIYSTGTARFVKSAFVANLARHVGMPGHQFVTTLPETLHLNSTQPTSVSPKTLESGMAELQMTTYYNVLHGWLNLNLVGADLTSFRNNGWFERIQRLVEAVFLNNYYWCQRLAITGRP